MTKAYSRFLAAFFCLFLGGLLVWHVLLPDRARSETENRTLAQRPELTWSALADGSFTKAVEDYFADQFPLRDGWTGVKARAELLLGKRGQYTGHIKCRRPRWDSLNLGRREWMDPWTGAARRESVPELLQEAEELLLPLLRALSQRLAAGLPETETRSGVL